MHYFLCFSCMCYKRKTNHLFSFTWVQFLFLPFMLLTNSFAKIAYNWEKKKKKLNSASLYIYTHTHTSTHKRQENQGEVFILLQLLIQNHCGGRRWGRNIYPINFYAQCLVGFHFLCPK